MDFPTRRRYHLIQAIAARLRWCKQKQLAHKLAYHYRVKRRAKT